MTAESHYRTRLQLSEACLNQGLETMVPTEASDDPATELARRLCFENFEYAPPGSVAAFSQRVPTMMDHGVRQAALVEAVFGADEIRDKLYPSFDLGRLGQMALVADVGLLYVPVHQVETILQHSLAVRKRNPEYGRLYNQHPLYGYTMARMLMREYGYQDPASRSLACFIARHHMVQAKNCYGMNWVQLQEDQGFQQSPVDQEEVDIYVALEKPLDYFDDTFCRRQQGGSFVEQASIPHRKFIANISTLFDSTPGLMEAMQRRKIDLALPALIADKLLEVATDDSRGSIGSVYRRVRRDLSSDNAEIAA